MPIPVDDKSKKKGPHNLSTKKISSLIFDQSKAREGMASPQPSTHPGMKQPRAVISTNWNNLNSGINQREAEGFPTHSGKMGKIDPVLKNATKHGNVPNSLLHDNNEYSPIKKNRRLTSGAQSNTNSDIRATIFSPSRKVEYADEVKLRMITRTEKKSRAGAAGISSTSEGFFMVDGELVQLNHDGKIVNPELRMSKDMPISAVFQMHDKQGEETVGQLQNKLKLMRGFNKSQTKKNGREESLPKSTANASYTAGAR